LWYSACSVFFCGGATSHTTVSSRQPTGEAGAPTSRIVASRPHPRTSTWSSLEGLQILPGAYTGALASCLKHGPPPDELNAQLQRGRGRGEPWRCAPSSSGCAGACAAASRASPASGSSAPWSASCRPCPPSPVGDASRASSAYKAAPCPGATGLPVPPIVCCGRLLRTSALFTTPSLPAAQPICLVPCCPPPGDASCSGPCFWSGHGTPQPFWSAPCGRC